MWLGRSPLYPLQAMGVQIVDEGGFGSERWLGHNESGEIWDDESRPQGNDGPTGVPREYWLGIFLPIFPIHK
jgi:hypothetical protein